LTLSLQLEIWRFRQGRKEVSLSLFSTVVYRSIFLLILFYPSYLHLFRSSQKKRVRKPSTEASREKNKIRSQKSRDAKRGGKAKSAKGFLPLDEERAMIAIKNHSADAVLFPPEGVAIDPFLDGLISPDRVDVGHSKRPLGKLGKHLLVSHFVSTGRKTSKKATKVVASITRFNKAAKPTTTATKHVLFVADSYVTAAEVLFRAMPITPDGDGKPVTKKVMAYRVQQACGGIQTGLSSVYNGNRLSFMTLTLFEAKEAAKAAAAAAAVVQY